ncbi:FAD/NAD(P)-binding domain containing protein [Hyaloscypha variabilis]
MPQITEAPYPPSAVPETPQCTPNPLKIIHVGCGAAGMLFAYKSRRWLKNYQLTIYEKNPTIGGTWYENRYPGCACDIPAHTYTFPFEPNPEWSGFYSYADEIQDYMLRTAKKWNVDEFTRFNTEVVAATWLEEEAMWEVELSHDGKISKEKCNVLVNGSGVVNKWKWPAVEGLHDFKGVLAHSAAWDTTIDWAGKKVAIIGSGSSSIQMVPPMAATAKHLTVFIRNCTYVGPVRSVMADNKEADPEAQDPAAAGLHKYTEKEKQRFREDPEYLLKYRKTIERGINLGFPAFIRGTEYNEKSRKGMQYYMLEKLSSNPKLRDFFVPSWSPGCRRLSPGQGYLEALLQDNVNPCLDEIIKVTAGGVLTADGTEHEVDILACATGFATQFLPHFKITGTGGQVMQDQVTPNVYASVAAPGFPNYFIVNGPRGNWGQGCALATHDVQIDYIMQLCKKMQEDRIKWIEPKLRLTNQLNLYMDAWHKKNSIWAEDCRSWYKDNKPDGRIYIWPGSMMHHMKYMKRPRWEHYEIEYKDPSNVFAFLGNGFTISEQKYGKDLPVDFIRNKDEEEWDIE